MEDLQSVIDIVNKLKSTSSTNDKIDILRENSNDENLVKVLKYTYSDNLQYGFSEKKLRELINERWSGYRDSDGWTYQNVGIQKQSTLDNCLWDSIYEMLDMLSLSNGNDLLINSVVMFLICATKQERELLISILTKDLRCNISSKTINKAIKGLITTERKYMNE